MPEGGKPFQSKLSPFYELIQRLRKQHTPYPEIARVLHDEHGLKVAASTIFQFVKVRAKRSGVFALPDLPSAMSARNANDTSPLAQAAKPEAIDGGSGSTPALSPTGKL